MSQQVGTATIATVAVVVVLVLGIIAWKVFGPRSAPNAAETQQQIESTRQDYERKRLPGGVKAPGYQPNPAPTGALR